MADGTKISWTEATWNPITGCSVVSAGCKRCYAMKLAGTRLRHHPSRAGLTHETQAGPVWNGQVRFNPQWLDQPLRWQRQRRIFVCAHGDLFHESVPDAWIDQVFAVMALAPQHTFQVLTKRAERMRLYLAERGRITAITLAAGEMTGEASKRGDSAAVGRLLAAWNGRRGDWVLPLPNVWLGVSVEDQATADERIPLLLRCPAAVRWISAEPLLGPVDLTRVCDRSRSRGLWINAIEPKEANPAHADLVATLGEHYPYQRVDWVVAGGESGRGARPMSLEWVRALREQCSHAGVAFFVKQLSGEGGRVLKDLESFPTALQIREYPHAA